ncbi:MAG TPA: endonuclease/exonuclease/phosphatase family protein [Acidimicrobiia bacterium]
MILVVIPAIGLALVSLAAFLGRWVWWLDVLANFRAQYVVGLLALGVLLMVGKWRRTGLAVLLVAVVNLVLVLPLYVGTPGESEVTAPSMRVMSFNLLSSNESYAEVLEYIEAIDPEIAFLHEASRPWEVAAEAADHDYQVIRARSDDLIFGTLVLVRGEEVTAVSYGFATAQPRAVAVTFRPRGWAEPVKVLSTHPLAPTDQARAGLRDAQLRFAGDWAEDQEGAFIVVGDFNATPWSWPFRDLMGRTELRNSQIGYGLQPSFPVDSSVLFRVPIDHLLHSEALIVRDRRLGPALGSDHFPLVVDLELR